MKCEDSLSGDPLELIPTTNQVVSEPFLKEMMLALCYIHHSFTEALYKNITTIDDLETRVNHVENKMWVSFYQPTMDWLMHKINLKKK